MYDTITTKAYADTKNGLIHKFQNNDKVLFSKDFKIGKYCGIFNSKIFSTIGSYSYTWSNLADFLTVGNYSSIAHGLTFTGDEHPLDNVSTSAVAYNRHLAYSLLDLSEHNTEFKHIVKQDYKNDGNVNIGNDVWIAQNVTIKRGINIPTGCVVGTRALVTKTPEPYSIIGGVPAKMIRSRFKDELIQDLLDSKWWEYPFYKICNLGMDNPKEFLNKLKDLPKPESNELPYLTNIELNEFLTNPNSQLKSWME